MNGLEKTHTEIMGRLRYVIYSLSSSEDLSEEEWAKISCETFELTKKDKEGFALLFQERHAEKSVSWQEVQRAGGAYVASSYHELAIVWFNGLVNDPNHQNSDWCFERETNTNWFQTSGQVIRDNALQLSVQCESEWESEVEKIESPAIEGEESDWVIEGRRALQRLQIEKAHCEITIGGRTFSNVSQQACDFFALAKEKWPLPVVLSDNDLRMNRIKNGLVRDLKRLIDEGKKTINISSLLE